MTSDAYLEPFYLNFSYKSNSHGCPICQFPKDANDMTGSKGDIAMVRQSGNDETVEMKSDTKEDAEML